MIFFTVLAWVLATIALLGEIIIGVGCFQSESPLGAVGFIIGSCVWLFICWIAFLILKFIAGFFGILVDEYGEEKVIGGAMTILLLGFFLGR